MGSLKHFTVENEGPLIQKRKSYWVRDIKTNERYLEVIYGKLSDPQINERFSLESSMMSQIEHPNVAPVIKAFTKRDNDDIASIVLGVKSGVLLSDVIQSIQSPAQKWTIALNVMSAFGALHARQIVFCCLAPSAVMLTDGRAILAGFGEARFVGTSLAGSSCDSSLGATAGTNVDVFGFGAFLYQLAVGSLPKRPIREVLSLSIPNAQLRQMIERCLDQSGSRPSVEGILTDLRFEGPVLFSPFPVREWYPLNYRNPFQIRPGARALEVRESHLLALVQGPGIPQIAGAQNGVLWVDAPGGVLLGSAGKLTGTTLWDVLCQMSDIVARLHSFGVVHRNLEQNSFVLNGNTLNLVDLSRARFVCPDAANAETGYFPGDEGEKVVTFSVDTRAFAGILLEVTLGRRIDQRAQYPSVLSEQLRDILVGCYADPPLPMEEVSRRLKSGGAGIFEQSLDALKVESDTCGFRVLKDDRTNERYAMYRLRISSLPSHPNVCVPLPMSFQDSLVFLLSSLEPLSSKLRQIDWPFDKYEIACGVASALSALHSKGIAFCNLVPDALVLDASKVVKLLDFSKAIQTSPKRDILDFGRLLYQLATSAVEEPNLGNVRNPQLRQIIECCMDPDADRRPSIDDILKDLKFEGPAMFLRVKVLRRSAFAIDDTLPRIGVQSQCIRVLREVNGKGRVIEKCFGQFLAGDIRERFCREADMLSRMSHPNLVGIIGVFEPGPDCDDTSIVLTWGERGALSAMVSKLTPQERWQAACDIVSGMEHMHARNVTHCDLKPPNIVVGSNGRIMVADFGQCRFHGTSVPLNVCICDGNYVPAERNWTTFIGPHNDVWAFGVILFELQTNSLPKQSSLWSVPNGSFDYSLVPNSQIRDMMRRCFDLDPARRPTMTMLLRELQALGPSAFDGKKR